MPSPDALYLDAQKSLVAGDNEKAMETIDASIAAEPTPWALFIRAKLLLDRGDDAAALRDCEAGLQEDPDDAKLLWLKGEISKPTASRFQGKFKAPPAQDR